MKRHFPSTGQSQDNANHAGTGKASGLAQAQLIRGEEFRSRSAFAVARLVLIYVGVSGAWILLSDNLVSALVRDPRMAQQLQTYKGWFFVIVTGALLGWLARRDLKRTDDASVVLRETIHELKLAEQRTADARNYNQTIFDASPVGLVTYKATGEVVSVNEAAARIIGATCEQVRAQNFRELESWRRYGLLEAAEKALADRQERGLETFMTSTFGKKLWLGLRFVPFQYAGAARLLVVITDVTAQKEAQEAQRSTKETLEAIVNGSPAAIFDIGADGRIQSLWNPAAQEMFGWPRDEAMGRLMPVLPDETITEFAGLRARVLGGASFSGIEMQSLRRDGSPIDISLAAAPLTDPTGRVTGVVAVAIDISERKRAEAALRESEAKFRTLVEQSLTGVYIIQDDRFVYVNPGLCTIFGYSPEELQTLNVLDIVREDDRALVAENLRKRLDNEVQSLQYTFRARHKDGRRLEVEVLGSRTELNGRSAIIGSALDVTARKQAEEQQYRLATEKDHLIERLQLHFNAMPIGCIVTAPDMTVLDWNPAAESIFGFSSKEMVGHPPYGRIIPMLSRVFVEQFIAELLCGNQTRSFVQENETKDGRRIFCEWHDTPLRDESGLVIGVIAMVQDVTERIKTEAALRELSARLLTAQDEERRRIARELHDTTAQQLAALALNLSVISRLLASPPPKVERILKDTIQLVETTAQEVRTTSYLLHPPILEAAGLVGAVRDYASGFARRSGIKINLELPDDLGRLQPEAELALFRMVQEGLGNIHRHSSSPTATIRLARGQDRVSLEMKDAGHGIPAETLAALQSKTGAVGVGIAGMRERLHQLKGGLEIESGPGGTTVRATLMIGETKQTKE